MPAPKTTSKKRLMLFDPDFSKGASTFVAADPTNNAAVQVRSLADLISAMESYTDVEQLIANTHGKPGVVTLADGTMVDVASFAFSAHTNSKLLAANAQIIFWGCNIGDTAAGDLFMDVLARSLLKGKGGTVATPTSSTYQIDFGPISIPEQLPPWGNTKVYTYDAKGARTASVMK